MQTADRIPLAPVDPATASSARTTIPVEAMVVKSLIAAPSLGETVVRGPVTIQGGRGPGKQKSSRWKFSVTLQWHGVPLRSRLRLSPNILRSTTGING